MKRKAAECYFLHIYIKFLCSIFLLIHRNLIMMIDVNQSPVLWPHANLFMCRNGRKQKFKNQNIESWEHYPHEKIN